MNWFSIFCLYFVFLHDPIRLYFVKRKYKKEKYFIPIITGNENKCVNWCQVQILDVFISENSEPYFSVKYNYTFNVVPEHRLFKSIPTKYDINDPAFKYY